MSRMLSSATLFIMFLAGCGSGQLAQNIPTNVPTPEPSVASRPGVVVRKEGWQIPGLEGSKVIESGEPRATSNEAAKVRVTKILPGERTIKDSFFSPEERRELKLSSGELMVGDIWRYEIGGRAFGYLVRVNPPGVGATFQLRFFDDDGDGVFESAEHASSMAPRLPSWAQ